VWSTLVAAVGGEVPPAAPPSLFAAVPDAGALSALDGMDGGHELSLVEEDAAGGAWQLLWRSRGGDPELSLLRWLPEGGVEAADDPARAAAMAERLRRRRLAFQECERGPGEEARHRLARHPAAKAAAGAADILLLPATGGGIPGP
jgi:hypothetical protein